MTTELGHDAFMSADDLRTYMGKMELARAAKLNEALDAAEKARAELVAAMSTPIDDSPERVAAVKASLTQRIRAAAETGSTEFMVMRFPNSLCTDRGRALNNSEPDWPATLTARPLQAYEFWRDHLRPAGYRLKAMIIEWPGGLPGDVGFFLSWADVKN